MKYLILSCFFFIVIEYRVFRKFKIYIKIVNQVTKSLLYNYLVILCNPCKNVQLCFKINIIKIKV